VCLPPPLAQRVVYHGRLNKNNSMHLKTYTCIIMPNVIRQTYLKFVQRIEHHGEARLHVLHLADVEGAVAVVDAVQVVQSVGDVLERAVLPHAVHKVL